MTATTSIRINALVIGKARVSSFLQNRPDFAMWDRDWFDSEAFLALSEGLRDYDENIGMSIMHFLERRIDNRLKNAIKKESRVVGAVPTPVHNREREVQAKVDFDFIMKLLEPRDQKIFYLYFVEENTMREIGHILGITTGRVHQILKGRILRKVRRILDGQGNTPKVQ